MKETEAISEDLEVQANFSFKIDTTTSNKISKDCEMQF